MNKIKKRGVYRHPGKIINYPLLRGAGGDLKKSIVEHHDFEGVSFNIWKYISSWYGYDYVVERQIKLDTQNDCYYLELYPNDEK